MFHPWVPLTSGLPFLTHAAGKQILVAYHFLECRHLELFRCAASTVTPIRVFLLVGCWGSRCVDQTLGLVFLFMPKSQALCITKIEITNITNLVLKVVRILVGEETRRIENLYQIQTPNKILWLLCRRPLGYIGTNPSHYQKK
jgi:hypothetical protein